MILFKNKRRGAACVGAPGESIAAASSPNPEPSAAFLLLFLSSFFGGVCCFSAAKNRRCEWNRGGTSRTSRNKSCLRVRNYSTAAVGRGNQTIAPVVSAEPPVPATGLKMGEMEQLKKKITLKIPLKTSDGGRMDGWMDGRTAAPAGSSWRRIRENKLRRSAGAGSRKNSGKS